MLHMTRLEIVLISLIALSMAMWWFDRGIKARKLSQINHYISKLETMRDNNGNLILGPDQGNRI